MGALVVEAAPAVAASALAIAFEIKFRIVGEDVMFAGHVKRPLDFGATDNLGAGIEFVRFGEVSDVARMQ